MLSLFRVNMFKFVKPKLLHIIKKCQEKQFKSVSELNSSTIFFVFRIYKKFI